MGSGQFDKAGILAADFSGLEAGSPGFEVREIPELTQLS
jgi:profilin